MAKRRRNPPLTLSRLRTRLVDMAEDEQRAVLEYRELLTSIPNYPELQTLRRVLAGILRDEENHQLILYKLIEHS